MHVETSSTSSSSSWGSNQREEPAAKRRRHNNSEESTTGYMTRYRSRLIAQQQKWVESTGSFAVLPVELNLRIMRLLDTKALLNFSETCKHFHGLCEEHEVVLLQEQDIYIKYPKLNSLLNNFVHFDDEIVKRYAFNRSELALLSWIQEQDKERGINGKEEKRLVSLIQRWKDALEVPGKCNDSLLRIAALGGFSKIMKVVLAMRDEGTPLYLSNRLAHATMANRVVCLRMLLNVKQSDGSFPALSCDEIAGVLENAMSEKALLLLLTHRNIANSFHYIGPTADSFDENVFYRVVQKAHSRGWQQAIALYEEKLLAFANAQRSNPGDNWTTVRDKLFMSVVKLGLSSVVEHFLEMRDACGQFCLDLAGNNSYAITQASLRGHDSVVHQLLNAKDDDGNFRLDLAAQGHKPWCSARANGHTRVAELLLAAANERGMAPPPVADNDDDTRDGCAIM